jgi:hypothetical protein
MNRVVGGLLLGASIAAAGLVSALADEIKGGIEGKVKKVDIEKETLTVTVNGKDRTFTITDETTMVGPRGGVVRRRLKDPRFHEGLEITVVATGSTATELHLGVDRKPKGETANQPKVVAKGTATPSEEKVKVKTPDAAKKKDSNTAGTAVAKAGTSKKEEEDDDDGEEFPGKVKSADPGRRLLVITLLNGKDRSFLLSKDVKISVKGTASKRGLEDPMVKPGIPVVVITETGGRKVKEVQVAPAPVGKAKKAG